MGTLYLPKDFFLNIAECSTIIALCYVEDEFRGKNLPLVLDTVPSFELFHPSNCSKVSSMFLFFSWLNKEYAICCVLKFKLHEMSRTRFNHLSNISYTN